MQRLTSINNIGHLVYVGDNWLTYEKCTACFSNCYTLVYRRRIAMTDRLDFIVKLGGCAITNKTEFESLKFDQIQSAATILARCWVAGKRFIVIHGAGSFGHHQASQFGLSSGYIAPFDEERTMYKRLGFCLTKVSVTKLNLIVTEELVKAGVPAVSHSTLGAWHRDAEGRLVGGATEVSSILGVGLVPVMHGDCFIEGEIGLSILSGDVICEVLCAALQPKCVIFLEDVAGVYDKPPSSKDAELVRELRVSARGQLHREISTSVCAVDVTGGIAMKLKSAAQIVIASDAHVLICQLSSAACDHACLTGRLDGHDGTMMCRDDS